MHSHFVLRAHQVLQAYDIHEVHLTIHADVVHVLAALVTILDCGVLVLGVHVVSFL